MVDERANRATAGAPKRVRRPRGGLVTAAARDAAAKPDLDARERRISPKRKAMGPVAPPEELTPAAARRARPSEEPPTDPE
jgi:hypothetical protein